MADHRPMLAELLGHGCVRSLYQPLVHRASGDVIERGLASRPAELLAEVDRVRAHGFGIAVDDLGADWRSLALLPFLRPDVVKIDLRVVQGPLTGARRRAARRRPPPGRARDAGHDRAAARQRAGRDEGGAGAPNLERRFEYVHTTDRALIVRAARALMLSIVPSQAGAAAGDRRPA